MPGKEKMTVMPRGGQPVAEPAGLSVDEDQGQPDDDRGDRQRDVDEGVEQPGAGEAVAGQDERDADAEDGVERARRWARPGG